MATNLTNTTFSTTYKDDYKDSDNYHRILFNSGKALQARELTQLQTIIQNEITRMGNNLFDEGSKISGGNITLNNTREFIKLASGQLTGLTQSNIVGATFTVKSPDPALQVKVLKIVEASGSDPDTLYVEYVNTSAGTSGTAPVRVANGATLENAGLGSSYDLTVASTGATGRGLELSIPKSSFYVQGRFVFVEEQSKFLSKYTTSFNGDVGFKLEQKIISATDNSALYDNQGSSPNIAAPGADRFQIKLTLATRAELSASDNFVYLAKVTNGVLSAQAGSDTSFNSIEKTLALRTKEESGDYIVKPFIAQFDELNDSNLTLKVSPGTAYVDGFRLNIDTETSLTVPKAQSTITKNNEIVVAQYGNYVLTNSTNNKGTPNISSFERYNLYDATNAGGASIGTARTRHVEEDGSDTRLYLFDIRMNSGKSFSSAKSLGADSTNYNNLILEDSIAVLKSTGQNDLLFPLPSTRPTQTGISPDSITIQKRYTFTTDGSGNATNAAASGSGLTYTSVSSWVVTAQNGAVESSPSITLNGTNTNFDVTGLTASTTYEVNALVIKASPSVRAKTLTNTTLTKTWPTDAESDGNGVQFISLDKADIFEVESIKVTDSDGADISTNWIVDNGQRDNYYGIGRLIPKGGITPSNGVVFSRFKHFTHGAGDFFDITSYNTSDVAYNKIPSHRLNNGEVVSLRDVADFRPVATKEADHNIAFDSDGAGGNPLINALPQNTGTYTADITYYMPRTDRLILTTKELENSQRRIAQVSYVQGTSDLNPQPPETVTGSLPLYTFNLNAFTLDDSDMTSSRFFAKRFTMKDIADLEERINEIEELTSLSLLELDTSTLSVIDSAGLERTKSGFLVDNFYDYTVSDIDRDEYRAVIDEVEGVLTPTNHLHQTRLVYDSADAASTTDRKGDNLYLPIDSDVQFLNQNLASETENVNPFAVINSKGLITLSPETDNWFETKYAPSIEVNGGTETGTSRAQANRSLAAIRNSILGTGSLDAAARASAAQGGRRAVVRRSVRVRRDIINDRVINLSIIPFMRSIKVYFKAEALKRNTRHYPYFGGVDISDYAREESFSRWSQRSDQDGNTYTNRTSHPDGSTNLVSDSNGEITGSFIIPASSSQKFRTGTVEFKLLDITGGADSNASSSAISLFTSSGLVSTREQTVRSTRVVNHVIRYVDPLAQSFLISSIDHPNGLFLTKARVYFAEKEATGGMPVELGIVPMENGVPTATPLPGAVKVLKPADVSVPVDTTSLASVQAAPTDFVFDEPVFLAPGAEYALVLKAESTAYKAYVAKTQDFQLGSSESRINKQPTQGSLFLSQNAVTWTPDQDRDLMFGLFHAQFATSASAILENANTPSQLLENNPFLTESAGDEVRVFHEGHGFIKNDKVNISGLTDASTYAGVLGSSINGTRTVTKVDHTGYAFNADSNFTSALRVGGDGIIASQNQMFDAFVPQISNVLPNLTTLTGKVKLTAGSSYANNRNTATGYSRAKASTFSNVVLNEFNFNDEPKAVFSDSNESIAPLSGAKSVTMQLDLSTTDNKVSPVVDLQRSSLALFENVIDRQDSAATTDFNVPISFVNETHATNGSSAAKHITKAVSLAEPAVGLKVLFAANRPSAASFKVYYKAGTSDDNLDDLAYVEVAESTSNPADENATTFRQYEYLAGGQVGNLNAFTKFQVKIVMQSTNSSKVPTIKDLRTIALVT